MENLEQKKRITLTAQEFMDAWDGGYKGVKEEDGKGFWEDNFFTLGVQFENIEVKGDIIINNIENNSTLKVRNSKLNGILIQGSKTNRISIFNSETESINIRFSTTELSTHNSTIASLGIINSTIKELHFFNSTVEEMIEVYFDSYIGSLFIDYFSIIKRQFYAERSNFYKAIFEGKELRRIRLIENYIQFFKWSQDSMCMLIIDDCIIDRLDFIKTNIPKDSIFQINNTFVNQFIFKHFVNTAWLNICGLKPLVKYEKFVERKDESNGIVPVLINNEFQLIEITNPKTILHFENSDLGKTSFVNCDLEAFDKFVFYNTKMLEVFVSGTNLPQKSKKIELPEGVNDKEKDTQERLTFGQFKKISENRVDIVQATEFLALEMGAYAKQIAKDSSKGGERINLWLNKFSSNWGNDWVRAVIVTLGINSLCFCLYCLSLGFWFSFNKAGFSTFLDLVSYSFEFLNPLRKADFLNQEINWLARIIDYASRIVVSYFTYQTIQAFRRFGKKS